VPVAAKITAVNIDFFIGMVSIYVQSRNKRASHVWFVVGCVHRGAGADGTPTSSKPLDKKEENPMEIMVVDDEPILRMVFSEILQDAGYSVTDAPTADEALAMLEKCCEAHVVVTDVHMPGQLNGFELAEVICTRWPHIGVVIVSGRLRPSQNELPDDSRFLAKPVHPEVLIATVQEVAATHG
jgi:CheY-like chemotaxis protein